jgi:hypothetical protein
VGDWKPRIVTDERPTCGICERASDDLGDVSVQLVHENPTSAIARQACQTCRRPLLDLLMAVDQRSMDEHFGTESGSLVELAIAVARDRAGRSTSDRVL